MLPSILAKQLQKGLSDYIRTTFPMTTPGFKDSLPNMFRAKDSFFHEPYVAVRLPFRVADEMREDFFQSVRQKYKPYVHQQKAFERLTGEDGRSTLIATGTGSGKTECFLYPILEYCYRHRGEKGIKALIIYPMNALATDQAKRIAELIHATQELRGNVTAGMYVGGRESSPNRAMTVDRIITDHETMLSSPPDILLTNYKMLDFLLVRPKDAILWKDNSPETLKYIAVDELHTFDGAQGTDLACLLRRLKSRLYTPVGHLCCIGTSATIGDKENAGGIQGYAQEVFGEPFEADAVVTEDRISAAEFFAASTTNDFTMPGDEAASLLWEAVERENQELFLETAIKAWFDDSFVYFDVMSDETRLAIGSRLMGHGFTQALISHTAGKYVQTEKVCEELGTTFPELIKTPGAALALDALYALISHARIGESGRLRPFVTMQVQLWMKELRRLVAKVSSDNITYALARELNKQQAVQYLPAVNCRDCGETGWVSIVNERGNVTLGDLDTFYNLYFKQDKKVVMIYPHSHDYAPRGMIPAYLCPSCLKLDIVGASEEKHHACSSCGTDAIQVVIPEKQDTAGKKNMRGFKCPHCGSVTGLSIIGLRTATAISASLSQLFASRFNDDKKTLAFSDNVQDAAHRAGFFNSRTWKPSLRGAIQKFAIEQGNGLSLQAFSDHFVSYWHDHLSEEEFVSRFIAPNMTWMRAYENMKTEGVFGSGQDEKNLMNNIEYRLRYEIMLEYGMLSRIGRTLEKSGCSVLSFDPNEVASVAAVSVLRAVNELGDPENQYTEELFKRIVIGFLGIMKGNGAFDDKIYGLYIANEGKPYLISNDREKWLPGLQSGRNTPRFLYQPVAANQKRLHAFDTLDEGKFYRWIAECFNETLRNDIKYSAVSKIILEELGKSGFFVPMLSPDGYQVWGLSKDKARISTDVKQFVCDACGHALSVSVENVEFWNGAPCQREKCGGVLRLDEDVELGYYGKLYSSGDLVRISAREHTGLLQRDEREELERTFKQSDADRHPWDTNVLSCTPTLEMGIDIGDLSSVILCGIPPRQANYLQRTGRAGRKDGNAFTLAVANAKPHDLYFYADPLEMMAGNVEPPKVFLKASAVLERQFLAYCMDSWIKKGVPENVIPKLIGSCLNNLTTQNTDRYPFNFLSYVQGNSSMLLRTFIQMFPELDDNEKADLTNYARGAGVTDSPMHVKVLESFNSLKKQKDTISQSIKQLRKLIKDLERKPKDSSYDEEIKELNSERSALISVSRSIDHKDVFNFLSDEGLLPNYAFPESGIILKAVLYRKEDNTGAEEEPPKKKYEKRVYEYSRSASAAISEFAPANHFYAEGRKLTINQIDLTSAQVAKWRLCPNCSHAQLEEAGKNTASCPECGSPAWADSGQVRSMLKVQMVYSNMDYTKSFIGDESDDRQTTFYFKQLLVDVNEDKDISIAYRMDNEEFNFGYEFVKKATLREINFGESDIAGEQLTIAGQDGVRKGFRICKYCGKIQPEKGKPEHAFTCKARNSLEAEDSYEEVLFLYREFATEALRILVPATTMDSSNTRQESFIAAFMLGMKEYFGNVDHLHAALSEVPVVNADYRKQYLVIYDSIPGGTGYLKQLMLKRHSLIEIFEKALSVLENCDCKNDKQKDGCYHCLFAYRQSRNIGQISRVSAIRLLKQILNGKENLEEIPKLSMVPVNNLFESELERRFIEALSHMGNDARPLTLTNILVHNKEGCRLKIGNAVWEIEPQVKLDASFGVSVETRADFVLWPTRTCGNQKPVAVYVDGFVYHKDRAADDTLKREAVRRSGKFRVWSLSWKDVQSVFKVQGEYATDTLLPSRMPSGSKMYKPAIEAAHGEGLRPEKSTSMELLAQYLTNPDSERLFEAHANAYAFSLLDPQNSADSASFSDWKQDVSEIQEALGVDFPFEFRLSLFGKWRPRTTNPQLTVFAGVLNDDMKNNKFNAVVSVYACLDDKEENRTDKYEQEWNGFWQFSNVMQFLKGYIAVSAVGLRNMVYSSLPAVFAEQEEAPSETSDLLVAWNADILAQILDESVKVFSSRCMERGIPSPDYVGYELADDAGLVIGEAELVWEKLKFALLIPGQEEHKNAFVSKGWTVISLEDEIQPALLEEM
jgi:DEAD/DEAH box helicase domain-containing protein